MKILQVTPFCYPAWSFGGPPKIVWELSKKLIKNGHDVTVWTTDAYDKGNRVSYPANKELKINKINVIYFRNVSLALVHKHKAIITPYLFIYALRNIKKFDLIHLHDFFTLQNVLICILARIYKIPYVISPHAVIDPKRIKLKKALLKTIYLNLFGKRILKGASKILAASDADLIPIRAMGIDNKRIEFIHHGIFLEEFQQKKRTNFRNKYNIPEESFVILFLSRLNKVKGLDTLINAFSQLHIPKIDLKLVIAGNDDGYLKEAEKIINSLSKKNKIIMTGSLFETDKVDAYLESDLFVLPSISEGVSLVALEAMAAKIPVIISKGSNFEDAEETKSAMIFQEEDIESLKRVLIIMIKNKKIREGYIKKGLNLVKEKYDFHETARKMEEVYTDIFKKRQIAYIAGFK